MAKKNDGIEARVLIACEIDGVSYQVNDVVLFPVKRLAAIDGELVDSADEAVAAARSAGGETKSHPLPPSVSKAQGKVVSEQSVAPVEPVMGATAAVDVVDETASA